MQRKRVDYFYSIFNIFVYNYEYSRNPPHPSTFLISSTLCHSTSIASSAWVMCLLSAYQKIVLLLSETGEKIQLSCLGILYVGIAHTFKTTYHSLKASFWNVMSTLLQLFILIKFIMLGITISKGSPNHHLGEI